MHDVGLHWNTSGMRLISSPSGQMCFFCQLLAFASCLQPPSSWIKGEKKGIQPSTRYVGWIRWNISSVILVLLGPHCWPQWHIYGVYETWAAFSAAETGPFDRHYRGSMLKTGAVLKPINLHADVPSPLVPIKNTVLCCRLVLNGNSDVTRFPWQSWWSCRITATGGFLRWQVKSVNL